ncbi:hypothetical protein FACS189438_1530 [Bacteroidia bacterium]|nr:hypothetical protein FACS189438_1530 [Bacteroidia bacterium]
MNKKFFTLIASVLMLVGFVGSGYAQVSVQINPGKVAEKLETGKKYQIALTTKVALESGISGLPAATTTYENWVKVSTAATGSTVWNAQSIYSNLHAAAAVQQPSPPYDPNTWVRPLGYGWIDKDGNLRADGWEKFPGKYYESIFCVNLSRVAGVGGQRDVIDMFSFANGFQLVVDSADHSTPEVIPPTTTFPTNLPTLNAGKGFMGEWGYSSGYGNSRQHWLPLYIYDEKDRTKVYVFLSDNMAPNGIRLFKMSVFDLYTSALPGSAVLFEFIEPAPYVLTAEDYNTRLGTDPRGEESKTGQKLAFWGDNGAKIDAKDKVNFVPADGTAPWRDVSVYAIDVNHATALSRLPGYRQNAWNGAPYAPGTVGSYDPSGVTIGTKNPLSTTPIVPPVAPATGWLYFKAAEGADGVKGNFLFLDTAYYVGSNNNLKFGWGDTVKALAAPTRFTWDIGWVVNMGTATAPKYAVDTTNLYLGKPRLVSDFVNQFRFRATYFWTEDSLAIDIAEANLKPQIIPDKFSQVHPYYWQPPYYEIGGGPSSNFTNATANIEYERDRANTASTATHYYNDGDFLHVKLTGVQTGESNVLTIGDRPIRTRINLFGKKGCMSGTVSIPEGVYVIRNANQNKALEKYFLWTPIYSDTTALWVSAEKPVTPQRLPAYHWIVKHVNQSDPLHSAVTIINREFPHVRFTNIRINEGDSLVLQTKDRYGRTISEKVAPIVGADKSFQPVAKEFLNDRHLGYFYIDEVTAKHSKFDLNYFHTLIEQLGQKQTFFMNKSDRDSSLVVDQVRNMQFTFKPQSKKEEFYGYQPTLDEVKKFGLDTLARVAYQLTTRVIEKGKPVEKMPVVNREHMYALDKTVNGVADSAIFLLKANYYTKNIDGKEVDFYALLDTNSMTSINPYKEKTDHYTELYKRPISYVKAAIPTGVSQVIESSQSATETHTFAVTTHTPPLYRRFDGNKEYKAFQNEKVVAPEPFGDATDKPVWLKFTRQNNFGFEFLGENSAKGLGNNNKGGVGGFDPKLPETSKNDYRQGLSAYGEANTSFLGYYNKRQYAEKEDMLSYTFYVDTAYSRRPIIDSKTGEFTTKPQYMLALRAKYYKADKITYDGEGEWHYSDGTPIPGTGHSEHREIEIPAFTVGDYLYNAQDSVNIGNEDFLGKYGYGGQGTTRLAFVRGIHVLRSDSFFVIPNAKVNGIDYPNRTELELMMDYNLLVRTLPAELQHSLKVNDHFEERYDGTTGLPKLDKDKKFTKNGKAMVFQFRLIYDNDGDRRFLIETQTKDSQYGPDEAKWVRWENGVPFLTDYITFDEASTDSHNGADIFNVMAAEESSATANEAATVEGAKVISGTGSVTILNAAGKTVTVTNVLGQVVAKTVATSDNATIALPKGIVVVSVDGNSSKALVK